MPFLLSFCNKLNKQLQTNIKNARPWGDMQYKTHLWQTLPVSVPTRGRPQEWIHQTITYKIFSYGNHRQPEAPDGSRKGSRTSADLHHRKQPVLKDLIGSSLLLSSSSEMRTGCNFIYMMMHGARLLVIFCTGFPSLAFLTASKICSSTNKQGIRWTKCFEEYIN